MNKSSPPVASSTGNELDSVQIYARLRTRYVGRVIFLFSRVSSTNATASKLAAQSDPNHSELGEGTLILADAQTRGRGRLGRTWISPPRVNLYASLILRPPIPVSDTPIVNCLAACAAVRAIQDTIRLKATVKWPNDILIRDKKVAGILTDLETEGPRVKSLVLGIGLNVNLPPQQLPEPVRENATSLMAEAGHPINRNELMSDICNSFEERYLKFLKEGAGPILDEFRTLTSTLGRKVRVVLHDRVLEGWAEDVDHQGGLILRTTGSDPVAIHSGDIIHLRDREPFDASCH